MNKKIIAPICTAVAMLGLAVGSTFALFTDKGSADINVLAGQVKIDYSMTLDVAESRYLDLPPYDAVAAAEGSDFDAIFENGGTAKVVPTENSINLTLDRLAPMDMIAVTAKAKNKSDINIRHRYSIVLDGELVPALQVVVDGTDYSTTETHLEFTSCWSSVATPDVEQLCQKDIRVYFPYGGDEQNFYQGKECDIKVSVEAIQGNAHVEDPEDEDANVPPYEEIHGEKPSTEEKFTYMFNSNGTVSTKTSGKSVAPETEELILNVENTGTPVVDVPTGKDFLALDVEELGLKTDNDVAVEVGVKIGSGKEGVEVYHDGTLIDSTYDTENGLVNFETKSFSPFDILWNNPKNKSYGFFDSYIVDEGLETEHWVHEISNAPEFRNIVTNEGNTVSDEYPGYEDPATEFVVINSIDLGGKLWEDYMDEVSQYIFTGTLRGLDNVVLSNYLQTEGYAQSNMLGDDPSMGLFNSAVCATFENLTLSNFTLDNLSGKICGFLAAGWSKIKLTDVLSKTGCELIAAEESLFFNCENVIVDETCSMNIAANAGSLIGQGREIEHFNFKDCYSAAYINGNNGANIGGFLGSSSVWSLTARTRTYVFDHCIFAGTISTNGANIAGLAAQITCNNAINDITVKDCDMAGSLLSYYNSNINNMSGIYIANVAKPSALSTSTFTYEGNSFTGTFIATLKAVGVSGYNYEMEIPSVASFYNNVIPANLQKVELGFDANNKLVVTNKDSLTLEYDSVLVQIKANKHTINIEKATDDAIKNSAYTLFNKEFATIADMEAATGVNAAYKVTRLGYFLPTENTTHPTNIKGETAEFEQFMMDYSHKDEAAYSNGYHVDENGAYFIKHNDGAAIEYIAFGNSCKNPSYYIVLMKDGRPVANGNITKLVTNASPFIG